MQQLHRLVGSGADQAQRQAELANLKRLLKAAGRKHLLETSANVKLSAELDVGRMACQYCDALANSVGHLVFDSTWMIEEVQMVLHQLCQWVAPRESEECVKIVDQNLFELLLAIRSGHAPEVACISMGVCPTAQKKAEFRASIAARRQQLSLAERGSLCATCQSAIGSVESFIYNDYTIKQLQAAFHVICSLVGTSGQIVCDQIMDATVEKVVDWVIQTENPHMVCVQLEACDSQQEAALSVATESKLSLKSSSSSCHQLRTELAPALVSLAVQTTVTTGSTAQPADSRGFPSAALIGGQIKAHLLHELATQPWPCEAKRSSQLSCADCVNSLSTVEQWLETSFSATQIQRDLRLLCWSSFLGDKQKQCIEWAQTFATMIFNNVKTSLKPNALCHLGGACRGSSRSLHRQVQVLAAAGLSPEFSSSGSDICTNCMSMVSFVEDYLTMEATEDQLETFLKSSVCRVIRGFEDTCENFADMLPTVISYLKDQEPADRICQQISLCQQL
jgi:hypothetical protein